jgi:hypothetical protein
VRATRKTCNEREPTSRVARPRTFEPLSGLGIAFADLMTLTCTEQTIGDALALELPEPRLGDPRRCARALLRSRLPPAQPSEASSTVPLSTSEP